MEDIYLMFHVQSAAKGHIRAKPNVCIPHVQIMIHYLLITHSTFEDWRYLGRMMLNEPGRKKLGWSKPCKQTLHAKHYSDLLQA